MVDLKFFEEQMVVTDRWGVALVVRAIQGGTYILATERNKPDQENAKHIVFEIVTEDSILRAYEPPSLVLGLWETLYKRGQ